MCIYVSDPLALRLECSPMAREIGVQSLVVIQKTQKMVLDSSLLKTQNYKAQIKGKVEQSRERSRALPLRLGFVAIENGAFGSPSTMVANFTYVSLCVCVCNRINYSGRAKQ